MNKALSIVPDYAESPDQAAEYLRMVLPLFSKCKAAANPINYSICYEYVSGKNEPLKEVLDQQIENEQPMSSDVSQALYKKFVLNGASDKFDEISVGLTDAVCQTLDNVQTTEDKANSSAENFDEQSRALASAGNITEVNDIVQSIILETKELKEASHGLKDQLHETNQEVEQLRVELEKMKEAAQTDALTGLLNRRAFDTTMSELINGAGESAGDTFLLLADIDYFKKVNDSFGHLVGDKVLRYTAKLLQQFITEGDMAARYGGEEMAILLCDTDAARAIEVAESIRQSLAKSSLKRKDNGESIGQITVSIGVSSLKADDTVESFIDRADTALYKAKEEGRNRVIRGN